MDYVLRLGNLLDTTCEMVGRAKLSQEVKKVWVQDFQSYPIDVIEKAFEMHRKSQSARFSPVPSAGLILEQIELLQAICDPLKLWPSAIAAWAIAKEAENEVKTVVWNKEMEQAWGVVRNIATDRYNAPKAFAEHYEGLVKVNKLLGVWPIPIISLGSDLNHRRDAIEKAKIENRISSDQAAIFLRSALQETPLSPELGLVDKSHQLLGLENSATDCQISPVGKAALEQIKKMLEAEGGSIKNALDVRRADAARSREKQEQLKKIQQEKFEGYFSERAKVSPNAAIKTYD